MRAVVSLAVVLFANSLSLNTRAEAQVKADDCSAAINGTMIGSHVEIHCLSKNEIALIIDELVRLGVVQRAESAGIETPIISSLAARLKPTQKLDFVQAVAEVSNAVDIAIKVASEGASSSGDLLVDEVLKRIAERTKANDPVGATREAEEGIARWEKQEAERKASAEATGLALLQAALKTDFLRFDATAAAARVEKIASLYHGNDSKTLFADLRVYQQQFFVKGRNKGINFSLEVAIAIARRGIAIARGPDERSVAQNDLGTVLGALGERENGSSKLEEAVEAFHAALKDSSRKRMPLQWAMTQTNLGTALQALGQRESGTDKLVEAVEAYHEALKEQTRTRVPFDWASTQMNLGNTLELIGEKENKISKLEEAVAAYREALKEETRARAPLEWAAIQMNLGNALSALGERENGTSRLFQAIEAYREALKEWIRERFPYQWALTQMNLGTALQALGQRESGTDKLKETIEAYREALKEWTRRGLPIESAKTQKNLGAALKALGERESARGKLEEARAALSECLAVTASVWPSDKVRFVESLRDEIQAEIERRSSLAH